MLHSQRYLINQRKLLFRTCGAGQGGIDFRRTCLGRDHNWQLPGRLLPSSLSRRGNNWQLPGRLLPSSLPRRGNNWQLPGEPLKTAPFFLPRFAFGETRAEKAICGSSDVAASCLLRRDKPGAEAYHFSARGWSQRETEPTRNWANRARISAVLCGQPPCQFGQLGIPILYAYYFISPPVY